MGVQLRPTPVTVVIGSGLDLSGGLWFMVENAKSGRSGSSTGGKEASFR